MWLLYGATGYTGQLIVEEAVKRGHRPVLAGRSEAKLRPLAAMYGLDYMAFPLTDMFTTVGGLQKAGDIELVLHAAGPFTFTSDPMIKACLQLGIHYLDITGELSVFENTFMYDEKAQERGVALISGVGFDIVPSDCVIKHLAERMPDATKLDVIIDALSAPGEKTPVSAGTLKSGLEMFANGVVVRRGGQLIPQDMGAGAKTFTLPYGQRSALPIVWGDLVTGYHTSGIPNITTYFAMPPQQVQMAQWGGYIIGQLLRFKFVRQGLSKLIEQNVYGPGEKTRETARSRIYARVTNAAGESAATLLETLEAYRFTAESSVRSVERVLAGELRGSLTPSQAFGADFVLDMDTTTRIDY